VRRLRRRHRTARDVEDLALARRLAGVLEQVRAQKDNLAEPAGTCGLARTLSNDRAPAFARQRALTRRLAATPDPAYDVAVAEDFDTAAHPAWAAEAQAVAALQPGSWCRRDGRDRAPRRRFLTAWSKNR
jgi:hypothetical protein